MGRLLGILVITTVLWFAPRGATVAEIISVDFDNLNDLDAITTQFPGLTFSNTIALTSGISLNEFEFPPLSGDIVASDDFAPIEIAFDIPAIEIQGFFTYLSPLTLTAFDGSNTIVDTTTSSFFTNLALW